jgi:hypothetical protein
MVGSLREDAPGKWLPALSLGTEEYRTHLAGMSDKFEHVLAYAVLKS